MKDVTETEDSYGDEITLSFGPPDPLIKTVISNANAL